MMTQQINKISNTRRQSATVNFLSCDKTDGRSKIKFTSFCLCANYRFIALDLPAVTGHCHETDWPNGAIFKALWSFQNYNTILAPQGLLVF